MNTVEFLSALSVNAWFKIFRFRAWSATSVASAVLGSPVLLSHASYDLARVTFALAP
jgi:hypothetical protein